MRFLEKDNKLVKHVKNHTIFSNKQQTKMHDSTQFLKILIFFKFL